MVIYRQKNRTVIFHLALLGAMVFASAGSTQIKLKRLPSSEESSVTGIIRSAASFVSVMGFCNAEGFACRWNADTRKLTCTSGEGKLIFSPDNPFYMLNDSVFQLPCVPLTSNDSLFIPVEVVATCFQPLEKEAIQWDAQESTLVIGCEPLREKPLLKDKKNTSKPKPTTLDSESEPLSAEQSVKTIVIDPGHGGKDPGAIGPDGTHEKEIVLSIGLKLRDLLKKKSSFHVYMTRETDEFIPLQDRTKFANEKKADVFVSIHANSIDGMKKKEVTKGYKVYFLSQAKNEEDKLAAMRENAVIQMEDHAQHYNNLQNILIDMVGNEYLRESQDLSITIEEVFNTSLKKIEKLNLGVGQANFWVLNGTFMPSVLVEVGFISNPNEEKTLKDDGFQITMATAMYDAILHFKKKIERAR